MSKSDFDVRSYAYQSTDESGGGMVLAYFNGNQEVPDETLLCDGKSYQRVDRLGIDYDSIPDHQRYSLAKMAIDVTQQAMNDPELRAKYDQYIKEKRRRKNSK